MQDTNLIIISLEYDITLNPITGFISTSTESLFFADSIIEEIDSLELSINNLISLNNSDKNNIISKNDMLNFININKFNIIYLLFVSMILGISFLLY